jgi:membrane protein implicated in regulation of membrane protease activity
MIYIYLIITVLSSALLITDMVLLYMEKIKSFGLERALFRLKGQTIPAEKFLPETLTMAFVTFLSLGVTGMLLVFTGLEWFFTLPLAIIAGMLVCFIFQYFIRNAIDKSTGRTLPKRDKAAGAEGFAIEEINNAGDGYGLIEFEYNNVRFRAPAVSAYETAIPEYERVIVLYEEDGVYFVQSIREVYEVIDEE